jgi:hypothetical protein
MPAKQGGKLFEIYNLPVSLTGSGILQRKMRQVAENRESRSLFLRSVLSDLDGALAIS